MPDQVQDGPWVFESPHVSALMDVGQARIAMENEAKEAGATRFGEGYHDFVMNTPLTPEATYTSISAIMAQDPEAWATVMRASLISAQGAENHNELKEKVTHLAVVALAWLEDIDGRTVMGVEP